jgi:hypothetical protein
MKIIMVLTLIMMLSSCATTSIPIPEKYNLDNQLERVKMVPSIRTGRGPAFTEFSEAGEDPVEVMKRRDTITLNANTNEWIKVDDQSFVIRNTNKEYYLLILNRPAFNLMGTDQISFYLLGNVLREGVDYLELGGVNYFIERIYKIYNTDQLYSITNQIVNSN